MPKAACCCKKCEWCDHNHDTVDWYNSGHLWYRSGNLEQCQQPNWNILGTLTTEIPSVGHVMPKFICRQNSGLGPGDLCPGGGQNPGGNGCDIFPCVRGTNLDTYGSYVFDPSIGGFTGVSYFRTPSEVLNNISYFWGKASAYGEIYPCWFNGLNMTNIERDEDEFLKFTFKLKIEKNSGNGYQTIVDLDLYGPGKNLRAHPDACSSYNVAGSDYYQWIELTGCDIFHSQDSNGFFLPCDLNFAKMPRGPWPYRFKRNIQPDTNLPFANGFEFPCRALFPDGSPNGIGYTKEQVLRAKEDPSIIGDPIFNESGNVVGIIGENILYCPLVEQPCGGVGPGGDSGLGGDQEANPEERCCSQPYCSNTEICYQLDEEGTPFGWEDVPVGCTGLSNYNSKESLRRFFCWWDPANRYTTPEWDLIDEKTNQSRKLSIHVVVPTKMFKPTPDDSTPGFCEPIYGEQRRSFGEWSFGMDIEAINEEIEALETAGYVWSNGLEDDGVWINKTPTKALRVLFTMDHADLAPGKVWRAFRDWDVKVNSIEKIFNEGTPEEVKFKISVEQKLEEVNFASLGCDCPSGYERAGPTGSCGPTGACGACGACGSNGSCGPTGAFRRILPTACGDEIQSCPQPIPGTTMSIPGFTVSNHLHCMNDIFGDASKLSFAERGPLVLNVDVQTTGVGCIVCNSSPEDTEKCECSQTIGGTTRLRSNSKLNGMKMILDSSSNRPLPDQVNLNEIFPRYYWQQGAWPSAIDPQYFGILTNYHFLNPDTGILEGTCPVPYEFQTPPSSVYNLFKEQGSRWLDATVDLPFPSGHPGSPMGGARYRNSYVGLYVPTTLELDYYNGALDLCGEPLYGEQICARTSPCPGEEIQRDLHLYAGFNEKPEDFPRVGPLGKCVVLCSRCKLRGAAVPCPDEREGNGGGGGDDGGGPNPCSCCPSEIYFSTSPPGTACPPADENCSPDPVSGQMRWCGATSGEGGQCYCTECLERPVPNDGCPHLIDVDEIGVEPSSAIYTPWGCSQNVISSTSRSGEAGCYDCGESVSRGEITHTCFGYPDPITRMYGMDGERIYFQSNGSNNAKGHLNNYECRKYEECCLGAGAAQGTNCVFTSCDNGIPNQYLDYCAASSQNYTWAFGDMTINWRKYLCQLRMNNMGMTFDPDIIQNMVFECNAKKGCAFDYANDYASLTGACKHIWRTQNGSCNNPPTSGTSDLILLYETFCSLASSNCTERDVGIKVEVTKYHVEEDNRGFLPFITKYEPNPNRNLLEKNRSHIIINAKGATY